MKQLLAATTLLAISGCSTTFVPPETAKPVPADRIFYQGDGDAKITVTRDDGYIGGGCYLALLINGTKAAQFDPEEKATFNVASGATILGVTFSGDGLCSYGQVLSTETQLKPGEHGIYRMYTGYSSDPVIIPVSKR